MKITKITALLLCLLLALSFASCSLLGGSGATKITIGENGNWYLDGVDSGVSAKGEKGDTGAQGPKGEQGEQGEPGSAAAKGDTGPQGPQGEKGDTGPQGPQGEKGDTGAQGPQGEKGDTGAQGPKGEKGDNCDHLEEDLQGLDFFPLPDGTYSVSVGKAIYLEEIVIPATHRGKAVTCVGLPEGVVDGTAQLGDAGTGFYSAPYLKKITLPEGITYIGIHAFEGCKRLTEINLPASLKQVNKDAFKGCSALTKVAITDIAAWCDITFGDTTANPLNYAKNLYLNGALVTDLTLPDTVTRIGSFAFYGCTSLQSIVIPESVTAIGAKAFSNCNALRSAIFQNTLGWVRAASSSFANTTAIASTNLSNASNAAMYLTRDYTSNYWKCE